MFVGGSNTPVLGLCGHDRFISDSVDIPLLHYVCMFRLGLILADMPLYPPKRKARKDVRVRPRVKNDRGTSPRTFG